MRIRRRKYEEEKVIDKIYFEFKDASFGSLRLADKAVGVG